MSIHTRDEDEEHNRRSYDIEIQKLKDELVEVKSEVTALRKDIKDLIDAWNTAKGVTSFVKWLSGIVTGCVGIYAFMKGIK